jgi:hypothetical protein
MGVTLPGVGWGSTRAFLDFLVSVPGVAVASDAASSFLFFLSVAVSLGFLAGVF